MAQAILLKDVENVGERGDVVDVSPGYLRNFLLPRNLAFTATPASIADAKRRMEAAEKAAADAAERAQENAQMLSKTVRGAWHEAGRDGGRCGGGRAEGGVEGSEQARGLKLERGKGQREEPIRTTGRHMVTVEVAEGATADVKTIITAE